jgi:hypothetical protein
LVAAGGVRSSARAAPDRLFSLAMRMKNSKSDAESVVTSVCSPKVKNEMNPGEF